MKKLPCSKKVLEYALVSISSLKSFLVGGVILMSTPGPFPLKGEIFLTCVADLGGTSGLDLELDNTVVQLGICTLEVGGIFDLQYLGQ